MCHINDRVDTEGVARTLKLAGTLLARSDLRDRVRAMRRVFGNHARRLNAVALVAEKTDA